MHLKRNDVVGPELCHWPSESPESSTTTTTSNNSNKLHPHHNDSQGILKNSNSNNNNNNPGEGLTTTAVHHHNKYNNSNNQDKLGVDQDGRNDRPLLIIDADLLEEGYPSPSTVSFSSASPSISTPRTKVDDGMTTSPASSLQDLSENVSCSSDRIHHPSISSGPPHLLHLRPPPRSVSSGSLSSYDESDLESCSSLEVDIHEISRSQWRNGSERDRLPLKPFQPFNDLSPSPPLVPLSHNVNTGYDNTKTFYDKPKLCLLSPTSPTFSSPPSNLNVNLDRGLVDNSRGIQSGNCVESDTGLTDVAGNKSNIVRKSGGGDSEYCISSIVSGNSGDAGEYFNNSSDDNINVVVVDVVPCSKNPTVNNQLCVNPEDTEKNSAELLANEATHLDTEDVEKDSSEAVNSESTHSFSDPEQESTCEEEEDLSSPPDAPSSPPLSDNSLPDIERRMAETEVKMNDAILSNGKEELELHGRKLKQFMKHRDTCSASLNNNNNNNNQNNNNNNNITRQLKSLTLNQEDPAEDNRLKSTPESPIVDAYEKECLDQPEKMVKELETQAKEGSVSENEDQDNQDKEEVHSSETEKEEDVSDKDEEGKENIVKETPVVNGIQDDGVDEPQVNRVEEKETHEKEIKENGIQDVANLINKMEENGTRLDNDQENEIQVIRNNQENETLVNGVLETQDTAEAHENENQENENQENENQAPEVPDPFVPYRRGRREREARRRRAAAAAASPSGSPCLSPARRVPVSPSRERTRPNRVTFEEGLSRREGGPQRRRAAGGLGSRHFRRSVPQASSSSYTSASSRGRLTSPDAGEFDVYTMETALPKIDWEAIESHLKATREEERRRRNDREEIRRKLAMGCDDEATLDRPHRKPSLHSRLQSGMNLQICFMNETASDCESQCSDTESTQDHPSSTTSVSSKSSRSKKSRKPKVTRHIMPQDSSDPDQEEEDEDEEEEEEEDDELNTPASDFFARQAQLQAEARVALAQAKEMARMQMEIEKQSKKKSPIADIVRASFSKIGVPFPDSKRRISRQILTDMNVAQLQVIVNDLHTQIESLNEELVTFLMERDDLHMEQDSMLVDIEDLTKHIGAKELSVRDEISNKTSSPSPAPSLGTSTPSIPSTPPLVSTPPLKTRTPGKLRGIVKK